MDSQVKLTPCLYRAQRDGLRRREKFQVPVTVSRSRRGEHLPALADDHAGVAVLHGVTAQGVPERLGIIVGVMVNEPRGDDPTLGIDDARGGGIELADPHDLAIVHRHVRMERGPPEPSTTRPFLMSRSYAILLPPCCPAPSERRGNRGGSLLSG